MPGSTSPIWATAVRRRWRPITPRPSLAALSGGRQQFMDLAGDGNLDLVDLVARRRGFYERTLDAGWAAVPPVPLAARDATGTIRTSASSTSRATASPTC